MSGEAVDRSSRAASRLLQKYPHVLQNGRVADLLLDPASGVTAELVLALLDRRSGERAAMAATAKHPRGDRFDAGEEDIAAIAKQISDHAEAIYQTWKSRGLAPAEILNCHTPPPQALALATASADPIARAPDMDKDNLEKLVSSFVNEDKARMAARRSNSPAKQMPSSIQFALQKFEKNVSPQAPSSPSPKSQVGRRSASPVQSPPSYVSPKPVPAAKPQIAPKTFLNQPEDTIEVNYPPDIVPQKPETPKRPAGLSLQSPQGHIQTWPLKNKVGETAKSPKSNGEVSKKAEGKRAASDDKSKSLKSKNAMTAAYLEEVAREEERLINALKTGVILNDEIDGLSYSGKSKSPLKERLSPAKEVKLSVKPDLIPNERPAATSKEDKSNVANMSLVDYAKIKYQDKIEHPLTQQRLDVNKQLDIDRKAPHLDPSLGVQVTETRSKFETDPKSDPPSYGSSPRWGLNKSGPRRADQVPHPELTTQQKQHIKAQADKTMNSPVRPFLTRGSVAERVLIFEKCPSELMLEKRKAPAITSWRTGHDVITKAQSYPGSKVPSQACQKASSAPAHTTLQRSVRAHAQRSTIPRFHFPKGRPAPQSHLDQALLKIQSAFATFPNSQVPRESFHHIVKACDCPLYWKMPLFLATQQSLHAPVDGHKFIDFWKQMTSTCHDQASRFVHLLTRGTSSILAPEDFVPLIQDVVDTHPGLSFLKEATEFHSRYVHTVIARIFYCVNRSWSSRISIPELRRANLLQVIQLLEEEEDINQVTAYFSYEHFYVIYCKFWELDRDHDLFIDKQDLARHNDHALSSRMIERVLSGCVTRGNQNRLAPEGEPRMSYTEFVWFLLAEEDKTHPTAIEYWFRCMDLDGDGFLSMYELEYFYEEQMHRMEAIGIETLPFQDCLCQMLDMVHPTTDGKITLSDLRKCKMTPIFFDTFFNLEKYLDHEQRDPFASQRDHENEMSEWDRFAAEEYELLVAEEGASDAQDQISYDENDDDCLSPNLDDITAEAVDEPSFEDSRSSYTSHRADHEKPQFVNLNSLILNMRKDGRRSTSPTEKPLNGYPEMPNEKPVNMSMMNSSAYSGGNSSFLYAQMKKSPVHSPERQYPNGTRVFARILNDGAVKETITKVNLSQQSSFGRNCTNGQPYMSEMTNERKISDNYEKALAEKRTPESKYANAPFIKYTSKAISTAKDRLGHRNDDDDDDYARDSDECSI